MSWFGSFLIALLTAVLACFTAGAIAAACVDWYHVSGREGGAGYFVIAIAFYGAIVGFIAGMVASRLVAASASPGFFKALAFSFGGVLSVSGAAALIAWGLADIPPRLEGNLLNLVVEVRLPAGETDPSHYGTKESYILFASSNPGSHVVRKS